jgi:GNAT superfamily N-acetyltransferase
MTFEFVCLDEVVARSIEHWFDDPDTARHLGGRDWIHQCVKLAREAPGTTTAEGTTVLARHCWVITERNDPAAFVDVEVYTDNRATVAIVVDPSMRGKGIARRVLLELWDRPELRGVSILFGGVDPGNAASLRCLLAAGFTVAAIPDHERMLEVIAVRPGS